METSLSSPKEAVRTRAEEQRKEAYRQLAERAPPQVLKHFQRHLSEILPDPTIIVGSYYPVKTEISPLPLLKFLHEQGFRCALPVVQGKKLIFREWSPENGACMGRFWNPHPA